MNIVQAIQERHSVRAYLNVNIEQNKIDILQQEIVKCNSDSGLNIQLITDDKNAFNTMMAHYGKFSNAFNYFAIVCKKNIKNKEILAGYYGEKLVLLSQTLGLNTCWVALTFNKKKNKIKIDNDEKLVCIISVGYGANQGNKHKIKTFKQVTKNAENSPAWFKKGVEAALLAPTALNQQKFKFTLYNNNQVKLSSSFGLYTKIDIGIVKYHFEIGADTNNFQWL